MATGKITKRTLDALQSAAVDGFLWDEDLRGLADRDVQRVLHRVVGGHVEFAAHGERIGRAIHPLRIEGRHQGGKSVLEGFPAPESCRRHPVPRAICQKFTA